MSYTLRFHNVHPDKVSVCFTWDDNFARHIRYIAPAFLDRGMRCTFYINPGEADFEQKHLAGYADLLQKGFEIGSHGFLHDNLCSVPYASSVDIVQNAIESIQRLFGLYPATFAFPYHDFNEDVLSMVKSYHLETRNTLAHSKRFAIKTGIPLEEMTDAVKKSLEEKNSLVFSGHSVILSPEEAINDQLKNKTGYNPILLDHLTQLLDFIQTKKAYAEVLTFEQAALKAFVCEHCEITVDSFVITQEHLNMIKPFHIDIEKLRILL